MTLRGEDYCPSSKLEEPLSIGNNLKPCPTYDPHKHDWFGDPQKHHSTNSPIEALPNIGDEDTCFTSNPKDEIPSRNIEDPPPTGNLLNLV